MKYKDEIFFGIMLVVFVVGLSYSLVLVDNMFDNQKKASCLFSKISITNDMLSEISRMEEHKQLCDNNNCTVYFNDKINRYNENLGKFLEDDFCTKSEGDKE